MQAAGMYLRTLRDWEKLTQKDVAQKLGVSTKQVERWEKGDSDPSSTALAAFIELVHGSAEQVKRLILDKNATEEDGRELARRWLSRPNRDYIASRMAEIPENERGGMLAILEDMQGRIEELEQRINESTFEGRSGAGD